MVADTGYIKVLAATRPAKGQKIDPTSAKVVNYRSYLEARQDAVLASVGAAGRKFYGYGYTFNGFAARLTPEQAAKLAATDGVTAVFQNQVHYQDTSSTPAFLGLDAPGGLWSQLGGPERAGEGR